MQELQSLPSSPQKNTNQLHAGTRVVNSYRDTRIGFASLKESFDRRFDNIVNSSVCNN